MKQTKRALFLECFSGISGDMTVAALLDLGADEKALRETLKTLDLTGYDIKISRAKKSGLDVCDFSVILEQDNHDHDMDYLHGHEHGHEHDHDHEHAHGHNHEHAHDHNHSHEHEHAHSHEHDHEHNHEHDHEHEHVHSHEHEHDHEHEHYHSHEHDHGHEHSHEHPHDQNHHHSHEHRGLTEVLAVLHSGCMSENALAIAERIFDVIADAEAAAHGVAKNEVHFHEVGAVDSIVDIAAIAICLDQLGYEDIFVPVLYEGQGTIRCQHGIIPVPVPAVSHIAGSHGLKLHRTQVFGELVTPTGAAVAAAVGTRKALPEEYTIKKVGLGGGKRNYPGVPGFLRAIEIEYQEQTEAAGPQAETDYIWKLESNIDDCSPEVLGYCMERLLEAGARDVHYTPVFMKKNRPAYELTVICSEDMVPVMESIIFTETTTIGIRKLRMERSILTREFKRVETAYGEITVKCVRLRELLKCYPEYESVKLAAKTCQVPFSQVFDAVKEACSKLNE